MKTASPKLVFALLVALAYTLGTITHLRAVSRVDVDRPDEGAFKKLLGDGRRLFAGQFVEMADVYFHSGRYPSIFDRAAAAKAPKAVTSAVGRSAEDDHHGHEHDEHGNCQEDDSDEAHVKAMTPPASQNWLESFIRRFRITEHTHLAQGNEREILPWLKVAIELDPQGIDTYTTAAFWLRTRLNRVDQAEKVLREGIRNNPKNYELLYEMGRLYQDNQHNLERARNIWRYAFKCWFEQGEEGRETTGFFGSRIACSLGELEKEAGNLPQAIRYFELAKPYSPKPEGPQKQIEELRGKLKTP